MKSEEIFDLCRVISKAHQVDPILVIAICGQESNYTPSSVRFEPKWNYLFETEKFARKLKITQATEEQLQKFSWGIMQVMGSVARELGFDKALPELIKADLGIYYGILKLSVLATKYKNQTDQIASYNGGNATKVNGIYRNHKYVDSILKRMSVLEKLQ